MAGWGGNTVAKSNGMYLVSVAMMSPRPALLALRGAGSSEAAIDLHAALAFFVQAGRLSSNPASQNRAAVTLLRGGLTGRLKACYCASSQHQHQAGLDQRMQEGVQAGPGPGIARSCVAGRCYVRGIFFHRRGGGLTTCTAAMSAIRAGLWRMAAPWGPCKHAQCYCAAPAHRHVLLYQLVDAASCKPTPFLACAYGTGAWPCRTGEGADEKTHSHLPRLQASCTAA